MTSPISIALSSDENYLDGLVGTLSGAIRSTPDTLINAVILDCGIHNDSWHSLEHTLSAAYPQLTLLRQPIHPDQLTIFNPSNEKRRLNNSSYARFLLPELLLKHNRIIYLDSDLHIDADLRPLYSTPLDGTLVGAVTEAHLPRLDQCISPNALSDDDKKLPAFNAGVMIMDLSAMRRTKLIEQIIALPDSIQNKMQDQSILNYLLRRKWKSLPIRWNRQRFVTENFSIYRDYPGTIWHFIGKMKPWHFDPRHMRGIVADFHRDVVNSGWVPRQKGSWRPLSPAWRDLTKRTRAFSLRNLRRLSLSMISS